MFFTVFRKLLGNLAPERSERGKHEYEEWVSVCCGGLERREKKGRVQRQRMGCSSAANLCSY